MGVVYTRLEPQAGDFVRISSHRGQGMEVLMTKQASAQTDHPVGG
jgi:hypothetical protein